MPATSCMYWGSGSGASTSSSRGYMYQGIGDGDCEVRRGGCNAALGVSKGVGRDRAFNQPSGMANAKSPPQNGMAVALCTSSPTMESVTTYPFQDDPTHKIPQSYLITGIDEQLPMVMCVLAEQAKSPNHKVIVFLPTARTTQLFAEVFNALTDMRVFGSKCIEIHSCKSQPQRNQASEEFRAAVQAILFSSDVSAQGMDYPGVTFVLQCGVPSDKGQYVHRLGRTARSGSGLLVLADFEQYFLQMVEDLPIRQASPINRAELDKMWYYTEHALARVHKSSLQLGAMAYQAWMGFYSSYLDKLHWSKAELVEHATTYALVCLKLSEVPEIGAKAVGKMGLKGTPGLRIHGSGH